MVTVRAAPVISARAIRPSAACETDRLTSSSPAFSIVSAPSDATTELRFALQANPKNEIAKLQSFGAQNLAIAKQH